MNKPCKVKKNQMKNKSCHTQLFKNGKATLILHEQFSKQSLAENNINNVVKSSILNIYHNCSTSRNRSCEVSNLATAEHNEKTPLQNEIETLKKEFE